MEENNKLYQTGTVSNTIFDRVLEYLNEKYLLRSNTISIEIEIKTILDNKWSNLNLNSLFIEVAQAGIEIPIRKLEILAGSHLIPQYNPLSKYFETLPVWDGENYIKKLCSYVKTNDDKAFINHMEK